MTELDMSELGAKCRCANISSCWHIGHIILRWSSEWYGCLEKKKHFVPEFKAQMLE